MSELPMRLTDAVSALDARAFERLCRRHAIALDDRMRLSPAEQAARQLAHLGRSAPLDELTKPARDVAYLLATHPAGLPRRELGGGVLVLLERDLAFAVPGHAELVAMPSELRAGLRPDPSEDPSSARVLIAGAPDDAVVIAATHLLGRRPTGPLPFAAAQVLEHLESPEALPAALATLSPKQSRLLSSIEARGGQLETAELLELEQSPIRYEQADLPSRSAAHALRQHALLWPHGR
ncbi:MAG: hypothetical protein IT378_19415, partial [Sandaracinaceae bacterium]|nr:hypothetical protein [Sandaracinaceae bacterium]